MGDMLKLSDSFDVLKNLSLSKYLIINKKSDLSMMDFPYYMKIDSAEHKLKMGGVYLCDNLIDAKVKYDEWIKKFNGVGIVIQEKVDGIELIVGVKTDVVFGRVLVVGFGGSGVEEGGDVVFRALRLKRDDVKAMLKELKGYKKIEAKMRGKVITFIEKVAFLIDYYDISEMDLNPVILDNKLGPVIVDARILIS